MDLKFFPRNTLRKTACNIAPRLWSSGKDTTRDVWVRGMSWGRTLPQANVWYLSGEELSDGPNIHRVLISARCANMVLKEF